MEKISIAKNKFYYLKKDSDTKNLIISNNELDEFDLSSFTLLLHCKNYYKYSNGNIIIEVIEDINLDKLKNNLNNLNELDSFELSNHIASNLFKKDKKLLYVIVKETSKDYKKKIKPYIESIYEENTHWIHEIIKGNREKENILYQNKNYIILKELSMVSPNRFYILGFPIKKITCLRDIKVNDIIYLDEIVTKMKILAKSISNINEENLYIFFHYHPSFYHLHLHCTFIENQTMSNKFLRYYLYDKVRTNILEDNNYYKKKHYFLKFLKIILYISY